MPVQRGEPGRRTIPRRRGTTSVKAGRARPLRASRSTARQRLRGRRRGGEIRGEFAQQREPPLADDALGLLGDDAEHAADRAVVVGNRAVRERVVGLLGKAAALEEEQQALVPGRLARR